MTVMVNFAYTQALDTPDFSFAWLTDTHVGTQTGAQELGRIVQDISSMDNVSFTIISGDITETDTGDNLAEAKSILDSLDIPYHIIPGNHDTKWSASGGSMFSNLWGDDRFNMEFGEYRFIGIHQGPLMRMGDGYIDPDDIAWVDSILQALPDPRQKIFIVMHYPLNPSIDNWYVMRDLLQDFNIQAVLHGHGHANRSSSYEGIPGIMSRSTLSRNNQPSGYSLVQVFEDRADFYERIPRADSVRLWHTLALGDRNFSDSLRLPRPDYSANDTSGVALLWQIPTGSIITSAPVLSGDKVLVSTSGGKLLGLNRFTGEALWSWQSQGAIHSTPAIKGDRVVFGSTDSSISCLSLADGNLKWQAKTAGPILASPLIHKNRVYIGSGDGAFYALNLKNGKVKWKYSNIGGYIETRPVLVDNKVMFGAWDGTFYALHARRGTLHWKWSGGRSGDLYSPATCWPVAANGKVFIVAPDRAMTAIDINTGKTVWRKMGHRVREMIGISEDGESIFARTMQDTVFAVSSDADEFKLKWIKYAGYGYDFAPSMMVEKDERTFFGTKDGWIYCLNSLDGEVMWKYRISDGLVNTLYPIDKHTVLSTAADGNVSLIRYRVR